MPNWLADPKPGQEMDSGRYMEITAAEQESVARALAREWNLREHGKYLEFGWEGWREFGKAALLAIFPEAKFE